MPLIVILLNIISLRSTPRSLIVAPESNVIVPAEAENLLKLLMAVKTPPTLKLLAVVTAPVQIVISLKVKVPELTIEEPTSIVMVPELGVNVQVEPLVRTPFTVKLVLAVTEAVEQEVVRSLNESKVPELVIVDPPFMVIAPVEGLKVIPELLVKVPATEKEVLY